MSFLDYEAADLFEAHVRRLERGWALPVGDGEYEDEDEDDLVFVHVTEPARHVYAGRVIRILPPGVLLARDIAVALGASG